MFFNILFSADVYFISSNVFIVLVLGNDNNPE